MSDKEKLISRYEVIFITKKEDKEKVKNLSEEIKSINNLKNFEIEIWKEIKPAYNIEDIKESDYALYFLVKFECEKQNLKLVNGILKSNILIRRYRILNTEKKSKKMKIGKIQNPKPRIRKRPNNFSKERENYKNREHNNSFLKKE